MIHNSIHNMFPFWAALLSLLIAQGLKPIFYWFKKKEWVPLLCFSSGLFPSSHSAAVVGLTVAVWIQEEMKSPLFAICLVFAVIVIYDAANVRFYAGQNIKMTQQLIKDLKDLPSINLDDPIYFEKVKDVLGHKWSEVFGGILIGFLVPNILYLFF